MLLGVHQGLRDGREEEVSLKTVDVRIMGVKARDAAGAKHQAKLVMPEFQAMRVLKDCAAKDFDVLGIVQYYHEEEGDGCSWERRLGEGCGY